MQEPHTPSRKEQRSEALLYLVASKEGEVNVSEVCARLRIGRQTARRALDDLVHQGRLKKVGHGSKTRYQ